MTTNSPLESLLADTLAAHDQLAPSPEDVLAGVELRLRGTGRARYVRPLAAAACVAAAAGVALGAVALTRPVHAGSGGPSSPQAGTTAVPSTSSTPPKGEEAVPPVTMPFDLTWLPAGRAVYYVHRINVGGISNHSRPDFDGEELFTVFAPSNLDIDVQRMPGTLAGTGFKSGAGRPVTVNGRPGNESVHSGGPGGYELYFETSDGLYYVNVSSHQGSTPSGSTATRSTSGSHLAAIGRHIARGLRLPGTTQVQPSFGVGYVPVGLKVTAFDIETTDPALPRVGPQGTYTRYSIGSGSSQDEAFDLSEDPRPDPGRSGHDVQGHRTRVANSDGYRTVTVLDAVRGHAVDVSGQRSYAQLYRIAEGLILPT